MFATEWAMGSREAKEAFLVREEVYIGELKRPRGEVFSNEDDLAAHLIVRLNGEAIASSRFAPFHGGVKLDQFCVKKERRGQGFFDLMVRVMLDKARRMGTDKVYVNAPEDFLKYFEAFGFQTGEKDEGGNTALFVEPENIVWHSACKDGN
ncbi:GNAT family N-acetyltransferase [Christensenellaceae bacterium OttesenSCG-928-M15]|nr:GNAT family N-acetyltransferase [Christensenellaceae bacterium OttesenSCG-928-M15]